MRRVVAIGRRMKGREMFIPPTVLYHSSAEGIWPRTAQMTQIHQRNLRHLRLKSFTVSDGTGRRKRTCR